MAGHAGIFPMALLTDGEGAAAAAAAAASITPFVRGRPRGLRIGVGGLGGRARLTCWTSWTGSVGLVGEAVTEEAMTGGPLVGEGALTVGPTRLPGPRWAASKSCFMRGGAIETAYCVMGLWGAF